MLILIFFLLKTDDVTRVILNGSENYINANYVNVSIHLDVTEGEKVNPLKKMLMHYLAIQSRKTLGLVNAE